MKIGDAETQIGHFQFNNHQKLFKTFVVKAVTLIINIADLSA